MLNFLLTHTPLFYFTQSLWRDEAYSVLVARRPIGWILQNVTFEPPVYYTLLHYWTRVFGTSEIALRSLSFLGFALATALVISWSEKLFKTRLLRWFVPLFFFFNPMLLYYAFEVRTYGWYIFFATLSVYAYLERKWPLYIAATVLGFYTHSYMIFVPLTQTVHWLLTSKLPWNHIGKFIKTLTRDPFARAMTVNALFISPWIIHFLQVASKLKSSWYFPVDFHLIKSVLGNMFVGYEGTPWFLWGYTATLSLILFVLFLWALRAKDHRRETSFFFFLVFVPLIIVIGVSLVKPLFVNRYLIPVTVAEVFLVAYAIDGLKNPLGKTVLAALVLLFVCGFNVWYPSQHPKLDIRKTMMEVNMIRGHGDVVFAQSPLVFFETTYYSNDSSRVYLYNPSGSAFPWYVGDTVFDANRIAYDLPHYPTRAFMVHEDGSYDIAYRSVASTIAASDRPTRPKSL